MIALLLKPDKKGYLSTSVDSIGVWTPDSCGQSTFQLSTVNNNLLEGVIFASQSAQTLPCKQRKFGRLRRTFILSYGRVVCAEAHAVQFLCL
ncbi:hypothetical protein Plhal304r1_c003g0012001 [Plasmopara halstedii]